MIRPPALQSGDTIGIISPSWGGAGAFPHRVAQGMKALNEMGFQVRLGLHALNQHGHVSDTPENRAADIHEFVRDPQVKAILSAIGGDHSCHLLPHLDFDLIHRRPVILMGFSDTTVLNVAIYQQTGLVTFNGPALLTDFAEFPAMLDYTQRYFLKALTMKRPIGRVEPAAAWTEEFLSWDRKQDQERPRRLQPSAGWTWLKPGEGEGRLLGGCIESLQHLRGTPYWPDWNGAILFFETSEEKPSPETIDGILMDYQNMGVLDQVRGLLVGRPMGYTAEEKQRLRQILLERTKAWSFPIVTDMDFGHTSPQMTLPLGCLARVDSSRQTFEIVEPAVE